MNHTIVDIETLFKQDLDDLWDINKKKDRTFERGYAIEKKLVSDSILFIGMNPSYDEEKALHGGFYIPQEGHYFSKAMRIAKDRKAPFCHHDLFFIRETNQNTVLCLRKKYSAYHLNNLQCLIAKQASFQEAVTRQFNSLKKVFQVFCMSIRTGKNFS